MAEIDDLLKSAETQIEALAKQLFKQYTAQAVTDAKSFMEETRDDLSRWNDELRRGEIDKEEFEDLVQSEAAVAEMRSLKQAGLAQVQLDTFSNGIVDIIVNLAVAAIP